MGRPSGSFTVALGEELKAWLVAAARAAGTTPAALTRQAIAEALRERASTDCVPAVLSTPAEPFKEIRARVAQSVAARLGAMARAAGMTRTAYVSAAAVDLADRSAARSGGTPTLGIETAGTLREALVKSNATIAPIARNLNQVARALNTYPARISDAERQKLAEVAHRLFEHLELASELLRTIRSPRVPRAP